MVHGNTWGHISAQWARSLLVRADGDVTDVYSDYDREQQTG